MNSTLETLTEQFAKKLNQKEEEKYIVNLTPMQSEDWEAVSQAKWASKTRKNKQDAKRMKAHRENINRDSELLRDFNETIRTEVDSRTTQEIREGQLPTRH